MRNSSAAVASLTLVVVTAFAPGCESDPKTSDDAVEEEECEPGTNCMCVPSGAGTKVCDPMTHLFVMCDCSKASQPITPPVNTPPVTPPPVVPPPVTPPGTSPVAGTGVAAIAGASGSAAGVGSAAGSGGQAGASGRGF
ncbi:MAG TPA: hypothetical protein VFG30_35915 [Polyangiales bacterium]|nr:hypothetical protein [Polyangiales bacterium]